MLHIRDIQILIILCVPVIASSLFALSIRDKTSPDDEETVEQTQEKIDDWVLKEINSVTISQGNTSYNPIIIGKENPGAENIVLYENHTLNATRMSAAPNQTQTIGLSAGGAKDIDNFRDNIAHGFLPQVNSITHEGLFYDYYFDTGNNENNSSEMFSPAYTMDTFINPLTQKDELWLSVGLNSNIRESDFTRKKLNIVVVLDISGSMNSAFDEYYYDQKQNLKDGVWDNRSKLTIACETICNMMDHLKDNDRFGMVVFESSAHKAKPLNLVKNTSMSSIKKHIMELQTMGGTDMYSGIKKGTELFADVMDADKDKYENRIIFITDAMPNRNITDKHSFWGVIKDNADDQIYSTVIGVGVDFQSDLVEAISKNEGANYYSIHSAEDFKRRLDDEFNYMVTPLVFNLNLVLDAPGYFIKRVCGTPFSDDATGEIMKVGTLFPSAANDNEVRGGIILVQLQKISSNQEIRLIAGYDDRQKRHHKSVTVIDTGDLPKLNNKNSALRKGVLLTHYVDLMHRWIIANRSSENIEDKDDDWIYQMIQKPERQLGIWEQTSIRLTINEQYKEKFELFKNHLLHEMDILNDNSLQQEVDLINKILSY